MEHVTRVIGLKNTYKILVGKPDVMGPLERQTVKIANNIKMYHK